MLARTIVVLASLSLLAQRRAQAAPMFHYSWDHVSGPTLGTWEEQRAPSHHFVASHKDLSPENLVFVDNVLQDPDEPMHPFEGSKVSSEESSSHAGHSVQVKTAHLTRKNINGVVLWLLNDILQGSTKFGQGFANTFSIEKLTKERNRINSEYFGNTITWLADQQVKEAVGKNWRDRSPQRRPSHQLPSLENFLESGKSSNLYMTQHNIHSGLSAKAPFEGRPYLMLWGQTQTSGNKIKFVHIGTGYVTEVNKGAAELALRKALKNWKHLTRAHV
ncbi:uncharacterized protein SRS1_13375 [Sporisorium reilianum f. sp. reilianum]|uniref:Uncharacterized protein n=1 Tax=Sporisorium reilianum f. sp. reilianum TaxID=72559 RepID=A0A2N8UC08_9BASI|nr:uncharacterized protein SRS1_13375 [Sporisorium reilianum f. sp. reilianum]